MMVNNTLHHSTITTQAYGLYKEDSRDYGSEVLEMLVKFIDTTENR
jgi:hypothetical protein